jgi:CheY-like chemotaxis protein
MTTAEERRGDPRAPMVLRATVQPSGASVLQLHTADVSEGGAFICSPDPIEVGTTLEVTIGFPGLMEPEKRKAVVRWVRPEDRGGEHAGFGVQWVDERRATSLAQVLDPSAEPPVEGGRHITVLVVDDNPHMRKLVKSGLEKRSTAAARFDMLDAEDGEAAWRILEREDIDLAILDYYMPNLNGGQLLKRIRDNERTQLLPVIVMSSAADRKPEVMAGGADFFLDKPMQLVDVLETVRMLLRL